jgi:hypothetical protein
LKREENRMFPTLAEQTKELAPEAYFDGGGVPPYLHIELAHTIDLEVIISAVRSIGSGSNVCGYIDKRGVHFHIPQDDRIQIDLSKAFIFVSQPESPGAEDPGAWQVLQFLQEPAKRALLIGKKKATLIEKSDKTMALCAALDDIWAKDDFQPEIMKMMESDESLEHGLAVLMKRYEEEYFAESSEMWEFWETFRIHLMEHRIMLKVRNFE